VRGWEVAEPVLIRSSDRVGAAAGPNTIWGVRCGFSGPSLHVLGCMGGQFKDSIGSPNVVLESRNVCVIIHG
jgi:hypothetical protein